MSFDPPTRVELDLDAMPGDRNQGTVQIYLDGHDVGHHKVPVSGKIYLESINPDGTAGYGFEGAPPLWLPIEQAEENPDQEILVWAAPCEDLPGFVSWCAWHPSAGFCVDELRAVTHYMPGTERTLFK